MTRDGVIKFVSETKLPSETHTKTCQQLTNHSAALYSID